MNGNIRWKAVIRDVIIIWILTFLGGFVIGVVIGITGASGDKLAIGTAVADIIFGIVGFTISGCMVKINKRKHLFIVAIGVWLVGIINIFVMHISYLQWSFGIICILFMMAVGGGLSCLFVKSASTDVASIDEQSNEHQNELK